MRDADKAVEKVLAGLRGCEPSAGFEGRVLRGARGREQSVRRAVPAYAFWAGALVSAGFLVGLYLLSKPSARSDSELRAGMPALHAPSLPGSTQQPHGAELLTETGGRKTVRHGAAIRRASREVSYPAPPLPLTAQEKLLLRVAHHRTAEAVASLTPETQIAQAAHEKEEFSKFFDQQNGETNE